MDFQSIAAKANFISNDTGIISGNSGSWGIGIPIYNLNANVALSGTKYDGDKNGIAYNVMASTEGYGKDAKTGAPSTTSILLIDGGVRMAMRETIMLAFEILMPLLNPKG